MDFRNRFRDALEDCRHLKVTFAADVSSGDFGVFDGRFGVVREDRAAGSSGMILFRSSGKGRRTATGVYLDKDFSVFAAGDRVYFDQAAGRVTSTVEGNRPVGIASTPASNADDLVLVSLEPARRPV